MCQVSPLVRPDKASSVGFLLRAPTFATPFDRHWVHLNEYKVIKLVSIGDRFLFFMLINGQRLNEKRNFAAQKKGYRCIEISVKDY